MKCPELCIRQEELARQLSTLIQKVSLSKDWAEELNRLALQDHKNSAPSLMACVKEKETKLSIISQKLERLLTGYLDQIIDEQDYRNQKAKLLSEKKSHEEEISTFSHNQNDWLAPPPRRKISARQRAKNSEFVWKNGGKSVGRASRVPPSGFEKAVEFCIGVFILPSSHLFSKSPYSII